MKRFTLHTNENKRGRPLVATIYGLVTRNEIVLEQSSTFKEEIDNG
jgi:hypothetical protein